MSHDVCYLFQIYMHVHCCIKQEILFFPKYAIALRFYSNVSQINLNFYLNNIGTNYSTTLLLTLKQKIEQVLLHNNFII